MHQNKTSDDDPIHWNNFDKYTLGAAGDSFYEYLLKSWLQSGKTDETSLLLYLQSVNGVFKKLVRTSEKSNLTYLVEIEYEREQNVMGHLTCFAGGMFALGGKTLDHKQQFELGAALTSTCHQSYVRSPTKLGPEMFAFNNKLEAEVDANGAKYYILRPEVIESYFILWRLTHDPRYRTWGWEAVEAIEKNCRISTGGYSGLRDITNAKPTHDDVQQSFFLAETLKYLYLLFSDDTLIDLDQWVFNTEAHPLPIKGGVNPLFRPAEFN
jgi:mannosyl-oligosaccharide alpha-1,2-mannosidase